MDATNISSPKRVIKRDGRIVKYNPDKIAVAVGKAMKSIGRIDDTVPGQVTDTVTKNLDGKKEVSVEEIQDRVEDALIKLGDAQLAKAYILYRAKRAEVRGFKDAIGIEDDLKLGVNALALLEKRYLKKLNGKKETPSQMFRRVAKHVAHVEKQYGSDPDYWTKAFYNLMANQIFLPNTPCLANAGREELNYLFACMSGDTVVRCCAGDYTVKELSEGTLGKEFDVLTIKGGKVGVAKASNAHKTGIKDLYRVTFDDNSHIDLTLDHKVMARDGYFVEVRNLTVGQSVMPFNYDINHGYQIVFEDVDRHPIATHKLVMREYGVVVPIKNAIHHKDYNKRNNSFLNLDSSMTKVGHIQWHSRNAIEFNCMYNPDVAKKVSDKMIGNKRALGCIRSEEYKKERSLNNPMYLQDNKDKITSAALNKHIDWVCPYCGNKLLLTKYQASERKICGSPECVSKHFSGENNPNYRHGVNVKSLYNHKVASVEFLRTDDVYDLSVDGTHNFGANNVFVHNCYAFEVGDSIEEIFQTVKDCAVVQKCIPAPTELVTDRGMVKAKDIVVGDGLWSINGFSKVDKVFKSGNKPVVDIVVDNEVISVGEEHLVYSYENGRGFQTSRFRCAKDLVPNKHRVAVFSKQPDTHNSTFPSGFMFADVVNGKINSYNNCVVPPVISSNVAYMLGLWFGDGSKDTLRVRFSNQDANLRNLFRLGLAEFVSKIGEYAGKTTEVCANNKKLSSLFDFIGFTADKSKIPDVVFGWMDTLKIAFIEGILDTDGSVKKQGHVCVISNKNKQPILDVQRLLKSLGFSSFISKINSGWTLYLYSCGINDFTNLTTFDTKKKTLLRNITSVIPHLITRYNGIEFHLLKDIKFGAEVETVDFEVNGNTYNVGCVVTHNSGGGVGLNLSKLRPAGDPVKSTEGVASGPIDFMRVFDMTSDVIKQGGIRRGGNLGLLLINHPDIVNFIRCKNDETKLNNFNISVAITDEFMRAVKNDTDFPLVNPKTGHAVSKVSARELFRLIAESAWRNGEPGFVFWDKIEADNPTPKDGHLIKNLCGEQDLLPYEACVLGSINLVKFVEDGQIVYSSLRKVVNHAVRFLDDVIDASSYPLEAIEKRVKDNRKIGLGVMGFANLLLRMGIPYDSDEAEKVAEDIMDFINVEARKVSAKLGEEKGDFGSIKRSVVTSPQRNATITTIAPTGSISIIAETSSGIEPIFAVVYQKTNILESNTFFEINPIFEEIGKREGWYNQSLVNKVIRNGGRVTGLSEVPDKWQKVFRTALEISPDWHVKMQVAFQKHVNNSISKTINLPYEATIEDVERIIKLAYDLNLKGLTVFRNNSRSQQVLETLCVECEDGSCPIPPAMSQSN